LLDNWFEWWLCDGVELVVKVVTWWCGDVVIVVVVVVVVWKVTGMGTG
jgi:hypothetical protein